MLATPSNSSATGSNSMRFTIFGASGFIGSRLAARLCAQGHECLTPGRGELPEGQDLGHVFYCIGLTADFRSRLAETVDAHVCHLLRVLARCRFTRLCYLSSTRVYKGLPRGEEDAVLETQPGCVSDLYDISKIMGEAACLNIGPGGVVVRLSNVFSPEDVSENFLPSILREAKATGRVRLRTALASSKDYVLIDDVLDMLPKILVDGREGIYNLASGRAVPHSAVIESLGCGVEVAPGAPTVAFPPISIARLQQEFGYAPRDVLPAIADAACGGRAWASDPSKES